MKTIRKSIWMLVMLTVMVLLCITSISAAADPSFCFTLLVDGQAETTAAPGDIITVSFTLERTDSTDPYSMLAMQNEIRYDSTALELIEDSIILKEGIFSGNIRINDREREVYLNYLSFTGGEVWDSNTVVGSFQMRVIGNSGTVTLTCRDCSVARPDGSSSYPFVAANAAIVIAKRYSVAFDSCGGSAVASQTVLSNEKASLPPMPHRDGHLFVGWYRDALCTDKWHFSEPVTEDLTLYAGWETMEPTQEMQFTDVPSDTWYSDSVRYVWQNDLMVGIGDSSFAPDMTTSRAMMVTILWRMEGCPVVDTPLTFADVAPDQWYTEAIRWAVHAGIANGYSKTAFGPDDTITREQMAAMLHRYAAFHGCDVTADGDLLAFADADSVSDWASASMGWAVDNGMILGVGNDTLLPLGSASRAQTATVLARFCIWQ